MKGNPIRGLLAEYGIVVDKRLERLRAALPVILEHADNGLTLPIDERASRRSGSIRRTGEADG